MNKKCLLTAGVLLALALTACGQKGGTVTLVNDSSYRLKDARISMGESQAAELNPGQWIKASHDKDIPAATAQFTLDINGSTKVKVEGKDGKWTLANWNSTTFGVQDGEAVVITIKNK